MKIFGFRDAGSASSPGLPPVATMNSLEFSRLHHSHGRKPWIAFAIFLCFFGTLIIVLKMPVYHSTLHAYRSWNPDHPRGYTERNKGYQPPNPERAEQYDLNAGQDKVVFDTLIQEVLILGTADICRRRQWRLHGAACDPSHVHVVLSWWTFIPWNQVMEKLKNLLSLFLGRATGQSGRRWFVVKGSRKRVKDREHLEHLLKTYLPSYRGLFWREGMELPKDRTGAVGGDEKDGK